MHPILAFCLEGGKDPVGALALVLGWQAWLYFGDPDTSIAPPAVAP